MGLFEHLGAGTPCLLPVCFSGGNGLCARVAGPSTCAAECLLGQGTWPQHASSPLLACACSHAIRSLRRRRREASRAGGTSHTSWRAPEAGGTDSSLRGGDAPEGEQASCEVRVLLVRAQTAVRQCRCRVARMTAGRAVEAAGAGGRRRGVVVVVVVEGGGGGESTRLGVGGVRGSVRQASSQS